VTDDRPPGRKADAELECTHCGEPYHKRCMHCHRPGVPYEYRGVTFDGLTAYRGERLCKSCLDAAMKAEGTNIRVTDELRGIDTVYNSVRDADLVTPIAAAYRYPDWNSKQCRDVRKQLRRARPRS
jgi:hypothetical protein